ncbi:IS200/IS605 family transposase [Paenibacillus mesophilus]|uniref:IS200/IS605 family transposase n=1 Tax=Paenibacillus mesophilus TaxID=2582849 RepID=UPI00110E6A4F|nr:IS200/IS605 family transposase [Paenibacillus mesophilus]TMV45783.1 IS200/IS605 family transposase [Paenibacillus mesophilus]
MTAVKQGRGYVYAIQYHIVWCVKDRHSMLLGDIGIGLEEILHRIAADNGFTISEIECNGDHVHLLLECTPQHSIPNMIKTLKGVSARLLFKEFPVLKKKGGQKLWNPSYFVATVSEQLEAQIRQYIQHQKAR